MTRYLPTTRHSTHSFFFFNDTAPTEIYTLSLHDALPICPGGALGVLRLEKLHVVEHLVGLVLGQRLQLALQPVTQDLDRKSTRLNSSHQIISYAVFCLKKKN